jgi:sugar lactone lactonase YvrE
MAAVRRTLYEGLVFAEGPRWRGGHLYLSDMFGHRVLRLGLDGRAEELLRCAQRPSGLGPAPDGSLLVVSMRDRRVLRRAPDGTVTRHADLSAHVGGDTNDLLLAPAGYCYVSNFGFDLFGGAQARLANLHRVDADGAVTEVARELDFPNGMVLTPDGRTLIVAETFGHVLTAFDVAPDGSLGRRRTFAALGERTPDGICLDADGAVWVASFVTGEFVRVREGGEVTDVVDLAGDRAVACTLGGPAMRTLFMLTARTDIERLARGDSTARVETLEVAVPGTGSP